MGQSSLESWKLPAYIGTIAGLLVATFAMHLAWFEIAVEHDAVWRQWLEWIVVGLFWFLIVALPVAGVSATAAAVVRSATHLLRSQ